MTNQVEGPPFPFFVIGLDLGKSADWTAAAVVEVIARPTPAGRGRENHYTVTDLLRADLGTAYPRIVEAVATVAASPLLRPNRVHAADPRTRVVKVEPGPNPCIVIDATGVGAAVVDMFLDAPIPARVVPLTITASGAPREDAWPGNATAKGWWVSKVDIVGTMQSLMQSDRFKIVPELELADTLQSELETFEVRVTKAQNEVFSHRTGAHDDLVLACGLACWLAEHRARPASTPGLVYQGGSDRRGRPTSRPIGPGVMSDWSKKYRGG